MLFGSGLRVQAWDHDTWWLSFLYLLLCCAEFLTFGRSATMAQAYISSISSSAALVRILTPVPCGTSCVRRLLGKSIASQELQVIRGWVFLCRVSRFCMVPAKLFVFCFGFRRPLRSWWRHQHAHLGSPFLLCPDCATGKPLNHCFEATNLVK